MDGIRGRFLGLPHGTTPAALTRALSSKYFFTPKETSWTHFLHLAICKHTKEDKKMKNVKFIHNFREKFDPGPTRDQIVIFSGTVLINDDVKEIPVFGILYIIL